MSTPPGPQDPHDRPDPYAQPRPGDQPAYPAPPPADQYGAQGAPGHYGTTGTDKNGLAVWSLVLGIVSLVCSLGFLAGIPAIVVGGKAKRAAAEGRADNAGMATAGIVLGWIGTILSILGIIILVVIINSVGWEQMIDDWNEAMQTG